jgi:peptide/nickel transport system substrate-binding protein
MNHLETIGIRTMLRALERVAFFKDYLGEEVQKTDPGRQQRVRQCGHTHPGLRRRRRHVRVRHLPGHRGLVQEQAAELDRGKREATLQKIQQLVHERAVYAPIWQLAFINGVGPLVAESGLGIIPGHAYSAPYEDLKLVAK